MVLAAKPGQGFAKQTARRSALQDLYLLDGHLARGRQDAQCAPGKQQEDGCRGGQAEGQGEEGGGAGDTGVAAERIGKNFYWYNWRCCLTFAVESTNKLYHESPNTRS